MLGLKIARLYTIYCLHLLTFSFLIGCQSNNSKAILFDTDSLKTARQNNYLYLDYLGKDTFTTQAIYQIDRNHLYRLKAHYISYRLRDTSLVQLLMDSTVDGGKTWSICMEELRIKDKRTQDPFPSKTPQVVKGFYVNKNLNKYIITNEPQIYYAECSSFELLNPDFKPRYLSEPLIDDKKNTLIILSGTDYYRIQDNKITSYPINNTPVYKYFTYDNDTLYVYYSEEKSILENNEVIKNTLAKIDTNGRVVEAINLPKIIYPKYTYEGLIFLLNHQYYIIGDFEDSTGNMYSKIMISKDYGNTWNFASVAKRILSRRIYFEKSSAIAIDDFSDIKFSNNYGYSFINMSDSSLQSDSIQDCKPVEQSNAFFVLGEGEEENPKHEYLFYPKQYSVPWFDNLSYYKIEETPNTISITVGIEKAANHPRRYNIRLWGATSFNYKQGAITNLKTIFKPRNPDSSEWKTTFATSMIDLHPGDPYKLIVYFADHTKQERYDISKTFTPVSFYDRHPGFVVSIACAGAILLILVTLLIVQPLWLYQLYKKTAYLRNLATVTGNAGKIFEVVDKLTIMPLFVLQPRVANAWVKKHGKFLINYFTKQPTVIEHHKYISLPIKIQSHNSLEIEKPSPANLHEYLKRNRTCIEIVGPGGVGKTTLGVQIGLWAMHEKNATYFSNPTWLPIIIEQETEDIYNTVKTIIVSLTNEKIDDQFLTYLLKKQKLLVIIDALSERSIKMQQHIQDIYAQMPINALIITSRTPVNIRIGENTHFYPQPMDFVKVAEYVKAVLINRNEEVFKSDINRSRLSDKIISIFRVGDKEIQILPILTTLMMKDAILLSAQPEGNDINYIINKMSSSIPDVFINYLLSVNPKTGENIFTEEEILNYSEIIALASLGDDYIPGDILLNSSLKQLLHTEPHLKKNIIDRLIKNGILLPYRRYGSDTYLRFALDPLAEYLAAYGVAKNCGADKTNWENTYIKIKEKKAYGFLTALEITQLTYADKCGWWK
jgi:hypothetical protein